MADLAQVVDGAEWHPMPPGSDPRASLAHHKASATQAEQFVRTGGRCATTTQMCEQRVGREEFPPDSLGFVGCTAWKHHVKNRRAIESEITSQYQESSDAAARNRELLDPEPTGV